MTVTLGTYAPPPGAGPGCEPLAEGFLTEPVSAVTSLAFVLAGLLIVALGRRGGHADASEEGSHRTLLGYAALVAAVGVGSVVQHGPDPSWSDLAHDVPLVAVLFFVAADAVADLLGRPRRWWWWVVPTVLLLPVVLGAPRAGDLAQAGVAAVTIGLTLLRARVRPELRPRVAWAVGLLAVGGAIGTLSRAGGPLCVPESLWQGHAAWHVLASAALVVLAPVVTRVRRPGALSGVSAA